MTGADYETLLAELCALQLADRDYPGDLKPDNSDEHEAHAARLARRAEIVAALLQIVNSTDSKITAEPTGVPSRNSKKQCDGAEH